MEKVPFGNTGFEITRLGFGAAPIGFLGTEEQKVRHLLEEVLDAGINFIDTAACYPGSEEMLGRTASDRRDDYVLASKCGHVVGDLTGEPFSPQVIADSIDQSLRRLRTDRIDVMLLHSCDLNVLKRAMRWAHWKRRAMRARSASLATPATTKPPPTPPALMRCR